MVERVVPQGMDKGEGERKMYIIVLQKLQELRGKIKWNKSR